MFIFRRRDRGVVTTERTPLVVTTNHTDPLADAAPPPDNGHHDHNFNSEGFLEEGYPSRSSRDQSFSLTDTVKARMYSRYKRDVIYNEENHLGVMFQFYGSVWPRVLPWCLAVMAVTYLFIYLRRQDIIDLTINDSTGHNFMSILVSFLLVTRVTITYNRFMEARQHLQDMFRSCRELIQYTCVLTNQNTNPVAQQWRQEVAYRTIVTLRLAMAAVEYRSTGVATWDILHRADHHRTPLLLHTIIENDEHAQGAKNYQPDDHMVGTLRALAHGERTLADENFRSPIGWMNNLRSTICKPRQDPKILAQRDWHVNETLKLLAITSDFMAAFHGLKKLIVTPFPFPLIQLNRIFLFAWCFSLPLVLINDNDESIEVMILVFFTTFGFMGLEYANIELDDPFGEDPNDFPSTRWAESVYEDVYITIYKTDGYKAAMALRARIGERIAGGIASNIHNEEGETTSG